MILKSNITGKMKRQKNRLKKTARVLSIDGGGIRGIIPAIILAEIEKITKTPISRMFDLIAGSSTGGVLALALAAPGEKGKPRYTAEQLISLYEIEGQRIFSRTLTHYITALGNIIDQKYPDRGLNSVLHKYFDITMLSESLTEIIIPAYEIERRTPFFFKSYYAKDPQKKHYDFLMKTVARATCAAPTYFEPARVATNDRSEYYALVDGGLVANNPAMAAYIETKELFPRVTPENFFLLSLGTGRVTRRLPYEDAKGWGVGGWAKPLLSSVYDAVSQTVNYQMEKILGPGNYMRIQARLDEDNDDLDNVTPENIRDLKVLAENLLWEKRTEIKMLCDILTK